MVANLYFRAGNYTPILDDSAETMTLSKVLVSFSVETEGMNDYGGGQVTLTSEEDGVSLTDKKSDWEQLALKKVIAQYARLSIFVPEPYVPDEPDDETTTEKLVDETTTTTTTESSEDTVAEAPAESEGE